MPGITWTHVHISMKFTDHDYEYECSKCEAKVELGGRIDKGSIKYRLSALQGGEDYGTVSKLYLAHWEMDKRYLGGHKTQQDSIQKIRMIYRKKMMKCQINGIGFHRWCFIADAWKYILIIPDAYIKILYSTPRRRILHMQSQGGARWEDR